MGGAEWPKLSKAPEEHIGAKVPVVTTSTRRAAAAAPSVFTIPLISSAVTTTPEQLSMASTENSTRAPPSPVAPRMTVSPGQTTAGLSVSNTVTSK